MCSYKVLFHRSTGYVVKCNSCSHYQVAFGTMVFTISTANMTEMFAQVTKLSSRKDSCSGHHERFQVKLPCDSVIMALTPEELKQYHDMLEEAFATEALRKLLSDNNIGR